MLGSTRLNAYMGAIVGDGKPTLNVGEGPPQFAQKGSSVGRHLKMNGWKFFWVRGNSVHVWG